MAMDLNKVMIIGRVTKTPELRTTPSGQNVTSFNVATNRQYTDSSGQKQEKAEFHSIVAWGKLAEICCQYLSKGRRVFIEGRLQTRDWVGQDGLRRYATEIIADNMIMLDAPAGSREGRGIPEQQNEVGYGDTPSSMPAAASHDEPVEQTIEEIPF
ncbi:single-stranded DNA-binding protein [Candidatus Uhrbacteria bacterium]|nr:single-stranded DNA-binding protein [Candidatus Uhrbacteria bacterium]